MRPSDRPASREPARPCRRRPPAGGCAAVESLVAAAFGVAPSELRQPRRGRAAVAFARQAAMYLAHVTLGLSLSDVGRHFGRDRTTVAHACALVEDRRDDPRLDRVLDCLATALQLWQRRFLAGEGRS